jgi:hypothetical protein
MIDVEQRLRDELDLLAPAVLPADWDGVLRLARDGRRRARRRFAVAAAVLVAALGGIFVGTPLGSAIVHGLGGFSAWLTGQPGSPASKEEQRAFDQANARSWLQFPSGTQLRRLAAVTDDATHSKVDLLGFRSKSTLCLRVVVTGDVRGGTLSCAPLDELRKAGAPVRAVLVDYGFGSGTKKAWYGLDRYHASALQVTVGIAADGVRRVVLVDTSGRHTVHASSNAFLYVASKPDVGQRVRRIWAETDTSRIPVPFAPAPFVFGGGNAPKRAAPGPTKVDRKVRGATIGWLDRHEPRGKPLDVLPARIRGLVERHAVFGRVIAPDPERPLRIAVTLSTSRHGHRPTGLCTWIVTRGGGGAGGCGVRATTFARGPITSGTTLSGGSDEFATITGLASDDVTRIVAFLSGGQTMRVPLTDNVYVVDIARSRLPARLVAYDSEQRVIGFTQTIRDFGGAGGGGPARGRARLLLHAVSPTGSTAGLFVGKSTTGGRCMYLRYYHSKRVRGVSEGCAGPTWQGPAVQLGAESNPAEFVDGRVRADVTSVVLRFADGDHATVAPTEGFVLYTVPRRHLAPGHQVVAAVGRNAAGAKIGTEPFPTPPPPKR